MIDLHGITGAAPGQKVGPPQSRNYIVNLPEFLGSCGTPHAAISLQSEVTKKCPDPTAVCYTVQEFAKEICALT